MVYPLLCLAPFLQTDQYDQRENNRDQLIARNEREIAELKSDLTLAVETPDLIKDFKHTKETLEIYKGFLDEEHRKRKHIEKAFVELGGDMDSLREQSK